MDEHDQETIDRIVDIQGDIIEVLDELKESWKEQYKINKGLLKLIKESKMVKG